MPSIDFKNIKVPYKSKIDIKIKADEFRNKFWGDSIPIDIEKIIDTNLRMNIVPIFSLLKLCDTDALISSDWSAVYVDNDSYMDDRWQNRLRFSLAHEIGHFILHKDLYSSFKIGSPEDFYNFFDLIPDDKYGFLETQANIFANNLLVPREILQSERLKILDSYKNLIGEIKDGKLLNSYLSKPISTIFGVSPQVIEVALNSNDDF